MKGDNGNKSAHLHLFTGLALALLASRGLPRSHSSCDTQAGTKSILRGSLRRKGVLHLMQISNSNLIVHELGAVRSLLRFIYLLVGLGFSLAQHSSRWGSGTTERHTWAF